MAYSSSPPEDVVLLYRQVGQCHVFNAIDLPGFQIAEPELEVALANIGPALSAHLSMIYRADLRYQIDGDGFMLLLERLGEAPPIAHGFRYPRAGTLLPLRAAW
jgi:hypothetical protein